MTDEKWEQISTMLQDKFEVLDHGTEDLDPGELEFYEFESPLGKIRIERHIKPKLLDRKMHLSTRIGAEGKEERVYSEDEDVSYFKAFKWEDDTSTWVEMDGENLDL